MEINMVGAAPGTDFLLIIVLFASVIWALPFALISLALRFANCPAKYSALLCFGFVGGFLLYQHNILLALFVFALSLIVLFPAFLLGQSCGRRARQIFLKKKES
jgi:hypothetical protein